MDADDVITLRTFLDEIILVSSRRKVTPSCYGKFVQTAPDPLLYFSAEYHYSVTDIENKPGNFGV